MQPSPTEYRWLVRAAAYRKPPILRTSADRNMGEQLTAHGWAYVDSSRLIITAAGRNAAARAAGNHPVLPRWDNRLWNDMLDGAVELTLPDNKWQPCRFREEARELELLGIATVETIPFDHHLTALHVKLTEHGEWMVEYADTRLSF